MILNANKLPDSRFRPDADINHAPVLVASGKCLLHDQISKSQFVWWSAALRFVTARFIEGHLMWIEPGSTAVRIPIHCAIIPNATSPPPSCRGLTYSQSTCYPAIPGVDVLSHVAFRCQEDKMGVELWLFPSGSQRLMELTDNRKVAVANSSSITTSNWSAFCKGNYLNPLLNWPMSEVCKLL